MYSDQFGYWGLKGQSKHSLTVPFQYTTEQVELDKLVFGRPGAVKDELPFPKNTQKKNKFTINFL